MSHTLDQLYELLPAVYRLRDVEAGYPLRALLRVINEQANVVEDDITQLYENWFIETCEDWVVPYIGDLIGYRTVQEAGDGGNLRTVQSRERQRILAPRREVAATIGNRRRKGTAALLELLANEVAGWPARVVEFYHLLGWTQHIDHSRPGQGNLADLRQGDALDVIASPFTAAARTVEVRRIVSPHGQGRYNLPSVGVFVWRLKTYSITRAPARCIDDVGPYAYTFSALGHDTPLYNLPQPETEPTHIAEELNLPVPIRRRAFAERVTIKGKQSSRASADYYGIGENGAAQSLFIWATDWPQKGTEQPIPRERIIPANLEDWRYRAPRDHVLVDPERGRMVFPPGQLPKKVKVSYHYAFSADIGGGEYDRHLAQQELFTLYVVRKGERIGGKKSFPTIQSALEQWETDKKEAGSNKALLGELGNAVIEIADSEVYVEQQSLQITLKQNESLQIRARNRTRPIIRMLDYTQGMDSLNISGARGSRFILDGLTVTGRGVQISKVTDEAPPEYNQSTTEVTHREDLCAVTIRHCTLVPGWDLNCDCEPQQTEPSLFVNYTHARVQIEHSIVGAIRIESDEVRSEPLRLSITDSIIDATSNELTALASPTLPLAYAVLDIRRSTVIGSVDVHAIELAENCIFNGRVRVARRQQGCIRFSYVPPGSRTPRRYECQPDLARAESKEEDKKTRAEMRVRPQIESLRYGTPTYCRLAAACGDEIKLGADDESEMGVFHDLYQPQRGANLGARLDEYTPAGMEVGIVYAD